MTMNPLPPQAYTKDTLTKAYLWLLHQNDSIKELATTPDVLVTLFLKAQRNGDDSLDTPSIQNFKNELKSLAGMMGELDRPQNGSESTNAKATAASSNPATGPAGASRHFRSTGSNGSSASNLAAASPLPSATPPPQLTASAVQQEPSTASHSGVHMQNHFHHSQPPPQQFQNGSSSHHQGAPSSQGPSVHPGPPVGGASSLPIEIIAQLDIKSRSMVAEVREQLNLGSDVEVLRLLISLGYKKARNLYS